MGTNPRGLDVTEIEERVYEALKIPRKLRLTVWDAALQEHKKHTGFKVQMHPHTLEYGFTCPCSGTEEEHRIDISCLKSMVPDALHSLQRFYQHHGRVGHKAIKRAWAKADMKAKALLHRYLTREQRFELRATGAFTVQGKDGRSYQVSRDKGIQVEHLGVTYSLCVHPKETLPSFDALLVLKVSLETDPETLLRTANASDPVALKSVGRAGFIADGVAPPPFVEKHVEMVELTDEQIENPREWVETRLS